MSVLDAAISRLQSELLSDGATLAAEALKANVQSHKSEFVLARIARESALRDAISESCVEWTKGGALPLMSAEDALLFYDRIFYGCALGRLLSQSGFSWNGQDESALLCWLLIDSWERISCLTWKWNLENPS